MKRIVASAIAAVLLAAATFSAPAAPADGQLDQILNNMQKVASGIKTLYTKMEQQKRYRDIGGSGEKSVGHIFFSHAGKGNDKVSIVYDVPAGQTLWVLGDKVTFYQKAINQAIVTSRRALASKNPDMSFAASPYQSVPELKSQYNIAYAGEEGGQAKLELTPKARSAVKQLTLWVDRSSWLPAKYQVVESGGNLSIFTLSNYQVNGKIPSKRFEVNLPGGTKIIKQ